MSKTDKLISKAFQIGDRIVGHSARKLKYQADILHNARDLGQHGVPKETVEYAKDLAKQESAASRNTRIKAGLGLTAATTTGFLGLHKYHQHKDNKILARIDRMYGVE